MKTSLDSKGVEERMKERRKSRKRERKRKNEREKDFEQGWTQEHKRFGSEDAVRAQQEWEGLTERVTSFVSFLCPCLRHESECNSSLKE